MLAALERRPVSHTDLTNGVAAPRIDGATWPFDPVAMSFENRVSDSERLLELVVRLSAKLHDPMIWEDIVCSATSLLRSEKGALLLADEINGVRLVASVGLVEVHRQLLTILPARGAETLRRGGGRAVIVNDVASYPPPFGGAAELLTSECRSAVYLPLMTAAGELQAVLAVFYSEPFGHAEREARLLSQLASVLAPLIANAQAQSSAREFAAAAGRRERRLHFLAEACAALSRAGGGVAALRRAASLSTSWMADRCVIEVTGEDGELAGTYGVCRLRGEWCRGGRFDRPDASRRMWLEKLLRTGEPILLGGLSRDHPAVPLACCDSEWGAEAGLSLLSVPLRRQGRVIGAMSLLRQQIGDAEYDEEDVACATEIMRHTELALDYESSRSLKVASRIPLAKAAGQR
ncbi:MAG: GAF domain-containing protein [Gemmatimonas sp.]|nr:GAF domain-containing protein [Gemmatimonas sp.]